MQTDPLLPGYTEPEARWFLMVVGMVSFFIFFFIYFYYYYYYFFFFFFSPQKDGFRAIALVFQQFTYKYIENIECILIIICA